MKVVIAEKPSVAREIAAILGALEKQEGFMEGNGYYVTWALGHLVGLAMPEDYGIVGFQAQSLPIVPDPFLLTVRKIKKNEGYIADAAAVKQLKVIEKLTSKCKGIIVATDAGREGELIFRYIYDHLKCKKPFERLWISSLTEKAIRQGFENLKDGSAFDGLYEAAKSRSHADWLVGINASQALSITAGDGTYSLGRVQTPTLALICKRYFENKNFTAKNYWQISLLHRKDYIDFKSHSETKWEEKKKADELVNSIKRKGKAIVTAIETQDVSEQSPLLFDLTGLQKEANKKLNFSADETLNIAQALYEKKFISYPRTGSKYIPEDLWAEIPNLVRGLSDSAFFKEPLSKIKWGRFNKRIVNDLKVTDHHGLLITDKIPSALSAKEIALYQMIALRLLESISAACQKSISDVTVEVLSTDFLLKNVKIIEPGWRSIQGDFAEDEVEDNQDLPELKVGDELNIKDAQLKDKKTKAPTLYTEAGLLSAMENAGRQIENADERKVLSNVGIGTPATRAACIETLFNRGYIAKSNKFLVPTEKGLSVYALVKDKKIADVSMTAEWEIAFQKIERKELNLTTFQNSIEVYATEITHEILSSTLAAEKHPDLKCPKCKSRSLIIKEIYAKCPDQSCNWMQFRRVCGVYLDIGEIINLVTNKRTSYIKGMVSRAGNKFDAHIVMNEVGETSFQSKQLD